MAALLRHCGIEFEWMQGVDGRALTDSQRSQHVDAHRMRRNHHSLVAGEIGCSLSHIRVYRDIVTRKLPCAVVLEDDMEVSDDFAALLDTRRPDCLAAAVDLDQPIVIHLMHIERHFRFGTRPVAGGRRVMRPHGGMWSTGAYFITNEAARRMAEGLYPVWTVADNWRLIEWHGMARLRNLVPHCAWPGPLGQESSIEPGRGRPARPPRTLSRALSNLVDEVLVRPLLVTRARPASHSRPGR